MAVVKINDVLQRMKELSSMRAVAGWVDGNGSADCAFSDMLVRKYTGETTDSLTLPASDALIARTLNYGREPGVTSSGRHYKRIPPRPFMTIAMERFNQRKKVLIKRHIPQVLRGEISAEHFYKIIGEQLMSCIQDAMDDSEKYVGLSDATIKARRHRTPSNNSAKPLIDTGHLKGSVTFEIRKD